MVRIITGIFKGRKLRTPLGEDITRPTSERIKGAMFSSIQFDVADRRVLDLFAGSGQLGFEALSRGAASVTFVDAEREVVELVKANAKDLGVFDKCRYAVSDWRNFIRKAEGRDLYDLVFVDPPYAMKCCAEAADRLAEAGLLLPGALVVLESGEEDPTLDAEKIRGYEVVKHTDYGKKTSLTVLIYRGREQ